MSKLFVKGILLSGRFSSQFINKAEKEGIAKVALSFQDLFFFYIEYITDGKKNSKQPNI